MNNKDMPCKTCLLLAVCKGKTDIKCNILWDVINSILYDELGCDKDRLTINNIRKILPNSKTIALDSNKLCPEIAFSFTWKE